MSREEIHYRLFGGYSGWGPGQLEKEIETGGWLLVPADSQLIFGPHEELWEKLMLRMREAHRLSDLLHIKHVPPETVDELSTLVVTSRSLVRRRKSYLLRSLVTN